MIDEYMGESTSSLLPPRHSLILLPLTVKSVSWADIPSFQKKVRPSPSIPSHSLNSHRRYQKSIVLPSSPFPLPLRLLIPDIVSSKIW
jgi:hypothetical protein